MIGLSLSLCVRDLAFGKFKPEDVEFIIAGTKAEDDYAWNRVIADYCGVYWQEREANARRIVAELKDDGKIYQPRVVGLDIPNIARTHWLDGSYSLDAIEAESRNESEAINMLLTNKLIEFIRTVRGE